MSSVRHQALTPFSWPDLCSWHPGNKAPTARRQALGRLRQAAEAPAEDASFTSGEEGQAWCVHDLNGRCLPYLHLVLVKAIDLCANLCTSCRGGSRRAVISCRTAGHRLIPVGLVCIQAITCKLGVL
jgi:hypothetical protein